MSSAPWPGLHGRRVSGSTTVKPERRSATLAWIRKAEHDLQAGVQTLKLGNRCPTDTVSFDAQQCVEKYLKACLVWKEIEFPRIHEIAVLLDRLPRKLRPDLLPVDQETLTLAATQGRYPGTIDPTVLEARHALRVARAVRREVRRWLLPALTRPSPRRRNHD